MTRILFVGDDHAFVHLLTKRLSDDVAQQSLPQVVESIETEWDSIVILDFDGREHPLAAVELLERKNAGVPIIAVASDSGMRLTNVSLALMHNFEAFFWKQNLDAAEFQAALHSCRERIARWQTSFGVIDEVASLERFVRQQSAAAPKFEGVAS